MHHRVTEKVVPGYVARTLHFLGSTRVRHIFGHGYDAPILQIYGKTYKN